jgi:hypothetical protein
VRALSRETIRRGDAVRRAVGAASAARHYHRRIDRNEHPSMCRNIKTLFNFEPPATEREIRDASLQFVRKLSGFNAPSKANEVAFERAVEQVTAAARELMQSLTTYSAPKNREAEAVKARARSVARFEKA